MKDINCPYCDAELYINHDDGNGYDENETHQQECENCGKTFVYTTSISYYYEAEKADCLNGGEHDYQPTCTYPIECTKMECSMCGEYRIPTESEMEEIIKKRGK